MAFKLKYDTAGGKISINLNRQINHEDINKIWSFISFMTGEEETKEVYDPKDVYNPYDKPVLIKGKESNIEDSLVSYSVQRKLGEKKVDHINLNGYIEPVSGFRIKILSFPAPDDSISTIKMFREFSGLPLMTAMQVVCGNHRCPSLFEAGANKILAGLKEKNVFASLEKAGVEQTS